MPGCCNWPGDPCLAEEALGRYRIGRVALGEQLDGDIAIEGGVAGAVDDAHAAAADLVLQFVARRAERGDGRLGGDVPGKSRGVDQVFGHGSSFPRSSAMACGWCEQLRLNIPASRLDFPGKGRIVTLIDAPTSRLVLSEPV